MPDRTIRAVGALIAVTLLALACASLAAAKTKPAALRVVADDGTELANLIQYTTTTSIPTDKHAKCFGPGTGGSGKPFTLQGATALGVVRDAMPAAPGLRPLSITDAFDFGPGICGIGGHVPPSTGYWDLRVNHIDSMVGGGQKLGFGDDVLWYETDSYPPGDELELEVPAGAQPGVPVQATVLRFDQTSGESQPLQGATVDFAVGGAPTDASGHTSLVFPAEGTAGVQARDGGDIPTTVYPVCVKLNVSKCPNEFGSTIHGSKHDDRIVDTRGNDFIEAARGDDVVRLRKGGRDTVNCGGGKDRVVVGTGVHGADIGKTCEKVVHT